MYPRTHTENLIEGAGGYQCTSQTGNPTLPQSGTVSLQIGKKVTLSLSVFNHALFDLLHYPLLSLDTERF